MPSHRIVVPFEGAKASAPMGCVLGALAWYFVSGFFVSVL